MNSSEPVYCVSSFHRSGTSMMMRCLSAASKLPTIADKVLDNWFAAFHRQGYHPNPNGFFQSSDYEVDLPYYYEARKGKLVKIVRDSLFMLTPGYYRLIFMVRDWREIQASMRRFSPFADWGPCESVLYFYDLVKNATIDRLRARGDFEILEVQYRDVVSDPRREFDRIKEFGFPIDSDKAASLVDQSLYRNRALN